MASRFRKLSILSLSLLFILTTTASAQSFRVQCPTSTITHPDPNNLGLNNSEPPYNGPTQFTASAPGLPAGTSGGFNASRIRRHIHCGVQHPDIVYLCGSSSPRRRYSLFDRKRDTSASADARRPGHDRRGDQRRVTVDVRQSSNREPGFHMERRGRLGA